MTGKIALVAVEKTYFKFDSDYDYRIPEHLAPLALVGARVLVGFGTADAVRSGFIVAVREDEPMKKLKPILDVQDEEPLLNEEMVHLALWLKERTFCTTYECLKTMLPRGAGEVSDKTIRVASVRRTLFDNENEIRLTAKQKSVVSLLEQTGEIPVAEVCTLTGVTASVLNALEKKKVIVMRDEVSYRVPYSHLQKTAQRKQIDLTWEQEKAFQRAQALLETGEAHTALLFGVTGAGKTQVFLKLIDEVMDRGEDAIVLVPEIALTPQTLNIFKKRYGQCVAVFHSGLSAGERADEFKRVRTGLARIVVGTRSAVFAPLKNLGLIVIDEEQEYTYKSEKSPRYHARDVAKFRCAYHKSLLLLASATPAIETYSNALSGKYELLELHNRFGGAVLPEVVVVDMKKEGGTAGNAVSRRLYDELEKNLDAGQQSILLINRRGYNTFIACDSCGHVITCPNCSISMTFHANNNKLMCHYCGYSRALMSECPACGSHLVRYSGYGTQRIEEEVQRNLPEARILRMDADTTGEKFAHEKKLKQFSDHDFDILLGTQMVAKGLDFHNVTLVGVVNADNSLYNESYTASERAFSLLTQVVGRSGRGGVKGKAVIQTINPDNPVIELSAQQDYRAFYDIEISMRKLMTYPPYCDVFVAGFLGDEEVGVCECASLFFKILLEKNQEYGQKIIVLGPSPAKISKISNKYRYRMAIKCRNNEKIRTMLKETVVQVTAEKKYKKVTVYVDLNPEDLN